MQRKAKKKKNKKKRKQAKKKRRRFKPTAIELSSLLKTEDAEYDKWRAKIGNTCIPVYLGFIRDKDTCIHTYIYSIYT